MMPYPFLVVKQSALQDGFSFDDLVILLAELKAEAVSQQRGGYVLGCDQILVCADQLFRRLDVSA